MAPDAAREPPGAGALESTRPSCGTWPAGGAAVEATARRSERWPRSATMTQPNLAATLGPLMKPKRLACQATRAPKWPVSSAFMGF